MSLGAPNTAVAIFVAWLLSLALLLAWCSAFIRVEIRLIRLFLWVFAIVAFALFAYKLYDLMFVLPSQPSI